MSLNRRVESLEERSALKSGFHLIFVAEEESQHEATKRYCCENKVLPEQLKSALYINPEDAATL